MRPVGSVRARPNITTGMEASSCCPRPAAPGFDPEDLTGPANPLSEFGEIDCIAEGPTDRQSG